MTVLPAPLDHEGTQPPTKGSGDALWFLLSLEPERGLPTHPNGKKKGSHWGLHRGAGQRMLCERGWLSPRLRGRGDEAYHPGGRGESTSGPLAYGLRSPKATTLAQPPTAFPRPSLSPPRYPPCPLCCKSPPAPAVTRSSTTTRPTPDSLLPSMAFLQCAKK